MSEVQETNTQEPSSSSDDIQPASMAEIMGFSNTTDYGDAKKSNDIEKQDETDPEDISGEEEEANAGASDGGEEKKAEEKKEVPKEEAKSPEDYDKELIAIDAETSLPRKELLNLVKADKSIRARFGEVGSAEQRLKENQAKFENQVRVLREYTDALTGADPVEGMHKFLSAMGHDSQAWFASLVEKLSPQFEKFSQMDESQREQHKAALQAEALRRENESLKQQQKNSQSQAEIQQMVSNRIKQEGISIQEFEEARNFIATSRPQDVKDLDTKQALEVVISQAVTKKHLDKVYDAVESIDGELAKDEEFIKDLFAVVANPHRTEEISKDDLVDIVKAWSASAENKGQVPAADPKKPEVKVVTNKEDDGASEEDDFAPISAMDLLNE